MEGRKQNYNIQEYEVDEDIRDEDNDNLHKESNKNTPPGNDSTPESQTHQDKVLTTLKSLESEICNKFNNLFSKVSSMERTRNCSCCNREMIEMLKAENQKLKEEIHVLQERNNNLAYVMSDLNTKIKDLDNEKLSLITAMTLLQRDYEKKYKEQLDKVNSYSWSTVRRTKANTDITFQHQNKYEVLNIEDDETTKNNKKLVLSDSDNEDGVDRDVDVSSKVDNCYYSSSVQK